MSKGETIGPPGDHHSRWRMASVAAREVANNVFHLPRSLRERGAIDADEAKIWLAKAQEQLQDSSAFFVPHERPVLHETPIGAGWFFTSFLYETSRGLWVIKISVPNVPAKGHPDASTPDHAIWYKRNLSVVQVEAPKAGLPFLIPQPQEALLVSNGERFATLILQPYIQDILNLKSFASLNREDQGRIIDEYRRYERFSRTLQEQAGLLPDRLGDIELPAFLRRLLAKKGIANEASSSNLVIGKAEDGKHHLILLDNGFADRSIVNAPVVNWLSNRFFEARTPVEKGSLIAATAFRRASQKKK